MNISQLMAKAEHFETLAARAAYRAATCPCPSDAEQWGDRAAQYDSRAIQYRTAAKRAA